MWKSKTSLLLILLLALAAPAAAQQWRQAPPTGWLGVTLQPTWMLDNGHCRPAVMVTRVVRGAPAERAGIREGDLLLRVNGLGAVEEGLDWMANRLEPGDTVRLAVRRDERDRELRAIAGQRPKGVPLVTAEIDPRQGENAFFGPQPSRVFRTGRDSIIVCSGDPTGFGFVTPRTNVQVHVLEARADSLRHEFARHVLRARVTSVDSVLTDSTARRYVFRVGPEGNTVVVTGRGPTTFVTPRDLGVGSRAIAGAEFAELNPDLARYFHGAHEGLLVLQVAPGTPAARAGLRPGDVVTRAANETPNTIADLRRVVAFGARPVRIEIIRDGQHMLLSLPRD